MNKKRILIVGSGFMSREYVKVLSDMDYDVTVVGRGADNIEKLKTDYPKFDYHIGGLKDFLQENKKKIEYAINAVSISFLKETTISLMENGVKQILLEKPGDLYTEGLKELKQCADQHKVKVSIAYNRRFYTSVNTLLREAKADGGVQSVHFEFTEWVHTISPETYDVESLKKWIISNSSHVINTVFSITGLPVIIHAIVRGKDLISWHPSGSVFTGSGIGKHGIPFSYHSNWGSAGRWAIEIMTKKRRFYLKPIEKLQVQMKGSVVIEEFPLQDELDQKYKAGIYLQTFAFLEHDYSKLVSLEEQIETNPYYDQIGGY
jgi:predicted dehydrogenase